MEKCNVGQSALSSSVYFLVFVPVVNGHSRVFEPTMLQWQLKQNKNWLREGTQFWILPWLLLRAACALCLSQGVGLHGTLLSPRSCAPGAGGLSWVRNCEAAAPPWVQCQRLWRWWSLWQKMWCWAWVRTKRVQPLAAGRTGAAAPLSGLVCLSWMHRII